MHPRGLTALKVTLGLILSIPVLFLYWHSIGKNLLSSSRMVEVPAVLNQVDLRNNCPGQFRQCLDFRVEYTYAFSGRVFQGRQPLLGAGWSLHSVGLERGLHELERVLAQKRNGPLMVWVDPLVPEVSAVENRIHRSTLVIYNFICFCLLWAFLGPENLVGRSVDWARSKPGRA